MIETVILNGRVLLPDGTLERTNVRLAEGRIAEVSERTPGAGVQVWDARGGLVLPGMVDLHGDAFERQMLPRPESPFPVDTALMETDRQLAANGITTAYYGITYSWEPGLRGRAQVERLLDAIQRIGPHLLCDTRVHLRWEVYNLEAEDQVAGWLATGRLDLLAFNDHFQHIVVRLRNPAKLATYLQRTGLDAEAFALLVGNIEGRANEVPAALDRLAKVAGAHGVPMASHDDETPEMRRRFSAIGCTICEFPADVATADAGRATGDRIILGAPNVVRDGSHCGRLHAGAAVRDGRCDILTSDYYYPSMLQSVFVLVAGDYAELPAAWRLVSTVPARAAGLNDRGEIATGQRADLVIVDDGHPVQPRARATLRGGLLTYAADGAMLN